MTIPASFLDELRQRITLSSLIGKSIPLKKKGREFAACCPFHDEKSASFYVNDAKGFAHCFGCSWHGDAIRWMTEYTRMDFLTAVRELASQAGLEIPSADPREAEQRGRRTVMYEIMARAERWFAANLKSEQAARDGADAYLAARAIGQYEIETFNLGWAPAQRGDMPNISEVMRDIPRSQLEELGLTGLADGRFYDFFRKRIIIPIHDPRGRTIGFGGRVINGANPKYLNSPDTPIFDKGRTLFNEHRAAPESTKHKRLMIVEGYMDVIAFDRAGIRETVAPNGTAVTEHQLARAWRICAEPVMCLDGDKAGRAAAVRAAKTALPILEPGKSISFATLPDGQDPDDLLRDQGPDALRALFLRPKPLHDLIWEAELAQQGDLGRPEAQAGLGASIRALVDQIRSPDVKQGYERVLGERFRAQFAARRSVSTRGTEKGPARKPSPHPKSDTARAVGRGALGSSIERAIIIGLINFPEQVIDETGERLFGSPALAAIYDQIMDMVYRDREADPAVIGAAVEEMAGGRELMSEASRLPFSFARKNPRAGAAEELNAALNALASRPRKDPR